MVSSRILIASVLIALLLHSEMIVSFAEPTQFLRDFLQYNIAGIPVLHQSTEWNFNPKINKQRRVQYEEENGRFGEHMIAKLGMGIGY